MVTFEMETLERALCIRGYHIYKEYWSAVVGEEFACEREPTNSTDRYAVAVIRSGVAIGHLPRKVSRACSLFLTAVFSAHLRIIKTIQRHLRYSH